MIADYSHYSREQLIAEIIHLVQQLELKEFRIADLLKRVYGPKSEKLNALVDQLRLFQEEDARQAAQDESERQTITYTRDKHPQKHPGRQTLPDHLRREEIVLMPDEDIIGCRRIGEEISEQLVIPHPVPYVRRYIRPKFLTPEAPDCSQRVIIAPPPKVPIDKCIASAETLTAFIVDKHVFHLPIYRQLQRLRGFGISISGSTADNWQRELAGLLDPLYQVHRHNVLSTDYLQADESRIQVQDPQTKGKTHRGMMWVYADTVNGRCLFDYQRGRATVHCSEILDGFSGYLQTDGYNVYADHKARSDIIGLACWAHARRKFHDALGNDEQRALPVLKLIQKLYRVEAEAREHALSYDQRYALRLERSAPILQEIRALLGAAHDAHLVPGTPIFKAVDYTLELWDHLQNFLLDGRLEIDNNLTENAIRPLALGRKNYLFAGSHKGAVHIAMYRSFFGTCKMQGVDPYAWLLHVLQAIRDTPQELYHTLLPQHIDRSLLESQSAPYHPAI